MTPPDPTRYYRIFNNDELLDVGDPTDVDGYVLAVTSLEVDPYDTGEGWHEEHAARATPAEHARWSAAYDTLKDALRRAENDLEAARAAWEAAQGRHRAALQDARNDYGPTHTEIAERREEVQEMRRQREQEQREAQERAAREAQEREDAELGPRTWVIYQPSLHDRTRKKHPEMFLPTIHLATCSLTHGREHDNTAKEWNFARAKDVEAVLNTGGPMARGGYPTKQHGPARLCGRCKPQDSLRQALGTVYESWQEEQDKKPLPMPDSKRLPAAMKLTDEWNNGRSRPGYAVMSDKYYRDEGLVHADEIMLGWYDPAKETIVQNEEALERLVRILPERGYTARRVKEPQAYRLGDKVSAYGVAVRRLSVWEQRQATEAAAAPGNTVSLEG